MPGDDGGLIELVHKRYSLLETLEQAQLTPAELSTQAGVSRATVNRAVNTLTDAGLVVESDGNLTVSLTGRLALDRYRSLQQAMSDLESARPVLSHFAATDFESVTGVVGGEVVTATATMPDKATDRFYEFLRNTEQFRVILPQLPSSRFLRLLQDHTVAQDRSVTVVLPQRSQDHLGQQYTRRLDQIVQSGNATIYLADEPSFGLAIATTTDTTEMALVAFGPAGGVQGLIQNPTDSAVAWARERWEAVTTDATDATSQFKTPRDGGTVTSDTPTDDRLWTPATSGFVQLTQEYFLSHEATRPEIAWQTQLALADVYAGYAIDRETTADEPLQQTLLDDLQDGDSAVLLGPAGSGKSTVLKQVAYEWYRNNTGPVWYHTGSQFDAQTLDTLINHDAAAASGKNLIVAEDVTRPRAVTLLEAAARVDDRPDVVFLFDSRRSEWETLQESELTQLPALTVHSIPALSHEEATRLIDRIETVTGETVSVAESQLDKLITEAAGPQEHGFITLLHRLVRSLDHTAEETTLTQDVDALYTTLNSDDTTLAAAVSVNLLNAAGVAIEHTIATALAAHFACPDLVETLQGRVLFDDQSTGPYRTVHESWSEEFLAVVQTEHANPTVLVGQAINGLLATSGDRSISFRSPQLANSGSDATAPDANRADHLIRALLAVAQTTPKLAGLFEQDGRLCFEVPTAVPTAAHHEYRYLLGQALFEAGTMDAVERVLTSFSECAVSDELDLKLMLLRRRMEYRRGNYDTALQLAETVYEESQDSEFELIRARAQYAIGKLKRETGSYEAAETHLQASSETFVKLDDEQQQARVVEELGLLALDQGAYQAARQHFTEQIRLAQQSSAQRLEAAGLHNLGGVAIHTGAFNKAQEHLAQALALREELGDQYGIADSVGNLGVVTQQLGEFATARAHYERSLMLKQELGDTVGQTSTHINLGELETACGEINAATRHLREGLRLAQEVGNPKRELAAIVNLVTLAMQQGDFADCDRYLSRGLALAREHGDRRREATCLNLTAALTLSRGALDEAAETAEQAIELSRTIGAPQVESAARATCADALRRLGQPAMARAQYQRGLAVTRREPEPRVTCELLCGLAALARQQDALEKAAQYLAAAREHATAQMPAETALINLTAARLHQQRGEYAAGREAAHTAQTLAADHGLTPLRAEAHLVVAALHGAAGDLDQAREAFATGDDLLAQLNEQVVRLTGVTTAARIAREHDASRWHQDLCERGTDLVAQITPSDAQVARDFRDQCS